MAGIGLLSGATLLSRRRFMRHHTPRTVDMLFLSWLVIAILVRFTVNCLLGARLLTRGPSGVGQAVTEFSMLQFSVIVVLLPLLSSMLSLGAAGLDRKRLMLGGIPLGSVTLIELVGIIAHPITWIALLFAVPAAIPLASLPAAGASIVALIPFPLPHSWQRMHWEMSSPQAGRRTASRGRSGSSSPLPCWESFSPMRIFSGLRARS